MDEPKHEFVISNGIRIHYVTAGEGPLLILLHGFPQFWYAWRHQIPELAKHYKVVVPDLRGYGETERPQNVSDYRLSLVSADITGLIQALGYEKAHIVGHDWGGSVAWKIAMDQPQFVDRLVVINSPHPYKMIKALRSSFSQMAKSWYIFFFQLPYLPESAFNMSPRGILEKLFKGAAIRKDAFKDEDIDQYLKAIEKPGALTAALNYYRALRESVKEEKSEAKKKIGAPTLLIWGEKDTALGKELTYGMESLFTGPFSIQYIENCSHWVPEEQPELVNRLVDQFVQKRKNYTHPNSV